MNLRLRGPNGQATVKVEPDCSLTTFRQLLEEKTGVPVAVQEVRRCRHRPPSWPLLLQASLPAVTQAIP